QIFEVVKDFFRGQVRRVGSGRFNFAGFFEDWKREGERAGFQALLDQLMDLGEQGIDHDAVVWGRLQWADALNPIRFVLNGLAQFDPRETLQNKVRGAVVVID